MTLEDLAAEFGVSRERVRQIEVRAFEKVQSAVKGAIAKQEAAALEAAQLISRADPEKCVAVFRKDHAHQKPRAQGDAC